MRPSRLALGTARIGMAYGIANPRGQLSEPEAFRVLDAAVDLGVRSFDTAPVYGDAESVLGRWLAASSASVEVFITTKLAPLGSSRVPSEPLGETIGREVSGSLTRLGVERIDRLLIHAVEDLEGWGPELAEALQDQVASGRVGSFGASVYDPSEATRAMALPGLQALQVPFNLLDTRMWSSGTLARARDAGIEVVARSVFLQGVLGLTAADLPEHLAHVGPWLTRLRAILGGLGWTPMELALPFVTDCDLVDEVVLGVDSVEQLEENVAAARRQIPAGLLGRLAAELQDATPHVVEPRRWARG